MIPWPQERSRGRGRRTGDPELLLQGSAPGAALRVAGLGVTGALCGHSQMREQGRGPRDPLSPSARAVGFPEEYSEQHTQEA